MKNDIGLTVVEGVANSGATFKDPSKRNIGLLGGSQRGVAWQPIAVTSIPQFEALFGGQISNYFGPRMVKSIFDEAGEVPVTINFIRAIADTNVVASKIITLADARTLNVKAGQKGAEDSGIWGNKLSVKLYSFDLKSRNAFVLETIYDGKVVESASGKTLSEIQNQVNTISKYIVVDFSAEIPTNTLISLTGTVTALVTTDKVVGVGTSFLTDLKVGSKLLDSTGNSIIGTVGTIVSNTELYLTGKAITPITAAAIKKKDDTIYSGDLTGGFDGVLVEADMYPISGASQRGLAAFIGSDTQLIAVTEFHTLTMAKKLNEFLKSWTLGFGIVNFPLNADAGLVEYWAAQLQTKDTSYLASYIGWAKVMDANGNHILIPGIAPILGAAYIRTRFIQGDYVHIPPGGIDSAFRNVVEMIPHNLDQDIVNLYVRDFSCNIVRFEDKIGYYVGSSRTTSTNELHQSIHIRLQTTYYKRVLGLRMKYLEQKPKTPELKVQALTDLFTYFKSEYDNGALEREIPLSKAYKGICDQSNNPLTQDRKDMNIDVLFVPTECVEAVKISLLRNDGILTIKE